MADMASDTGMPILVVDDFPTMVRILRNLLKQIGFEDVDDAADGESALTQLRARRHGLVISDWNMPVATGLDALRQLRAAGNAVPFGFITSEGSQAMREEATAAGASFLVTKPFTADDVRDALTAVL